MAVKILHVSDTHGWMPTFPAGDYDVIVHSGDLLPNASYGNRPVEEFFQAKWIADHAAKLLAWIGTGRPFLYTPGNHDYVDPTPVLRRLGVDARFLVGALDVDGVRFWGHPWTPEFCGWNWMCEAEEMREHLEPVVDLLERGEIDVFVSHGPMFGVLDRNRDGSRCGSHELREVMQNAKHPPRLLLHGHIHEAAGLQAWSRGMIVSNAATTHRVLELPKTETQIDNGVAA